MKVGQDTSITAVLVAGAIASILLWLLGYFAPGLMATAPATVEDAFGIIITAAICYFLPAWGVPDAPPAPPAKLPRDSLVVDDDTR